MASQALRSRLRGLDREKDAITQTVVAIEIFDLALPEVPGLRFRPVDSGSERRRDVVLYLSVLALRWRQTSESAECLVELGPHGDVGGAGVLQERGLLPSDDGIEAEVVPGVAQHPLFDRLLLWFAFRPVAEREPVEMDERDASTWPDDPDELGNDLARCTDPLQHVLGPDGIEGAVGERQAAKVARVRRGMGRRCPTIATAPNRPRYIVWFSSMRPALSLTPRPVRAVICRGSSRMSLTLSSRAASWRTVF